MQNMQMIQNFSDSNGINVHSLGRFHEMNSASTIPDNISEASCSTVTSTNKSKVLLPNNKPLGYQPAEITASRLSFQYAMANPVVSPLLENVQINQNSTNNTIKFQNTKNIQPQNSSKNSIFLNSSNDMPEPPPIELLRVTNIGYNTRGLPRQSTANSFQVPPIGTAKKKK